MATLVIGGTGNIGGLAVAGLLDRGEKVTVMTRTADKIASLPGEVSGVVGNLADPPSLRKVLEGIDNVFLVTAVHPDEARHGQNGVHAAKKAGVKRVVYLSVALPADSHHIPHFASKITVENALRESGMAFTVLRPNNFFQNDFWYKDAMMQFGLYPQPIGMTGVWRVDSRDVADAAVSALTESGHEKKIYSLHGPDNLTGRDCAAIWGKHLGSEINYMGDDLDKWSEAASASMPAWMVHDFRIMYDYFQKSGFKPAAGDAAEAERVLHHKARSFDAFCAETAAVWKQK